MTDLTEAGIWITGASSGIGEALLRRLTGDGSFVAASARRAETLEELVSGLDDAAAYPLDVTDAAATAETVAAIEDDLGPIDLAILGAGTYTPVAAKDLDVETARRHIDVNYMGVVNAVVALLPRMLARGRGRIAVIASVAGYRGLPQAAAYGPTKAALISFCETLRGELDGTGVEITVINPGFVKSRLTDLNDFDMPFLMTPETAADRIVRGLSRSGFEIAFPWRFVAMLKTLRLLPYRFYFPLIGRMIGR